MFYQNGNALGKLSNLTTIYSLLFPNHLEIVKLPGTYAFVQIDWPSLCSLPRLLKRPACEMIEASREMGQISGLQQRNW